MIQYREIFDLKVDFIIKLKIKLSVSKYLDTSNNETNKMIRDIRMFLVDNK